MYEQTTFGRRYVVKEEEETSEPIQDGRGDFRGPYGYGRPAHKADPSATYVFSPSSFAVPRRRTELRT